MNHLIPLGEPFHVMSVDCPCNPRICVTSSGNLELRHQPMALPLEAPYQEGVDQLMRYFETVQGAMLDGDINASQALECYEAALKAALKNL